MWILNAIVNCSWEMFDASAEQGIKSRWRNAKTFFKVKIVKLHHPFRFQLQFRMMMKFEFYAHYMYYHKLKGYFNMFMFDSSRMPIFYPSDIRFYVFLFSMFSQSNRRSTSINTRKIIVMWKKKTLFSSKNVQAHVQLSIQSSTLKFYVHGIYNKSSLLWSLCPMY